MSLFNLILFFFITLIISTVITYFIRNFSIKNNLYDIPNERSSHSMPIPKGGGLSIIILLIITTSTLFYFQMISREIFLSIIIGLNRWNSGKQT